MDIKEIQQGLGKLGLTIEKTNKTKLDKSRVNEFIGTLSTEILVKLNAKAPPGMKQVPLTTSDKNK